MRFQFSITDVLISTALIAVGFCSGVYLIKPGPDDFHAHLLVLFFTCGVIGAGAFQLFHKPFLGVGVGFGVAMAILALMFLRVAVFFRHG